MSHAVSPEELHATARPYGDTPFLLYVGGNGTVRVNHVSTTFAGNSGQVLVTGFGRGVATALAPDLTLSLLWQPHAENGFSLIADGTGTIEQVDGTETLVLTVSGAVLHRPAPSDGEGSC